MKNFQPLSFVLGLASGLLVLSLFAGGMRLLRSSPQGGFPMNGGAWQQRQGGDGGPNMTRMAQQLGMTEDELRTALAGGKTMQDIAKEKGVELPAGRGGRPNPTGSGAFVPPANGSNVSGGTTSSAQSSISGSSK